MSRGALTARFRSGIGRLEGVVFHPLTFAASILSVFGWLIAPGLILPDTKVDLVVSPGRYLERALQAWSTHTGFGELQNQAYGYLFPMGSFFWAGEKLGAQPWEIQRAWWSLLLVVGGVGAGLLGRRIFRLGSCATVAVAVAYALSPRVISLLSHISIETWPGMVMPWLILAVHRYVTGRVSFARYVVQVAALAVCLGGVNATASLVALLGAGVWAASAPRARWKASAGAVLGGAMGAFWWLAPLVVLGAYSYDFLDYIETSSVTTAVTSIPAILRGASDWVPYLTDAMRRPVWRGGWDVVHDSASIVGGVGLSAVAMLGIVVARGGDDQSRRWLTAVRVSLVVGLLGMGVGFGGVISGPFADPVQAALDGAASAARNVHKLDPLVRLPLALGIGFVIERLAGMHVARWRRAGDASSARRVVPVLAATGVGILVATSIAPFWSGRVAAAAPVWGYPYSVTQTAAYIDAQARAHGGSTLLLPNARHPDYVWGSATDEPLSASAASPVAYRAAAPLVHPGAQRLMDEVDSRLSLGQDVDAVAGALANAGVARVAIRHGLTYATQTNSADAYVRALLHSTAYGDHRVFGEGSQRIDVFSVRGPIATGNRINRSRVNVLGGPESTVTLRAVGLEQGVGLLTGAGGGWVTDDVRNRIYSAGRPAVVAYGPTLPADASEPLEQGRHELFFPGWKTSRTTLALTGLTSISATKSLDDPFKNGYRGPGAGAASAIDASEGTSWLSEAVDPGRLTLTWKDGTPRAAALHLSIQQPRSSRVRALRTRVDDRRSSVRVRDGRAVMDLPKGTKTLTLELSASGYGAVGIRDIRSTELNMFAVSKLPGSFDSSRMGAVMTRQRMKESNREVVAEDAGVWARRLTVTHGGETRMKLLAPNGTCAKQARIGVRIPGERDWTYHSIACDDAVKLPEGQVEVLLPANVERAVLTPRSGVARLALGLPSAHHGGGSTHQSPWTVMNQGANAGWLSRPDAGSDVVDGWRQAFTAPVATRFGPQQDHERALVAGGVVAGLCLLAALVPWGTRPGVARRRHAREELSVPPSARVLLAAAVAVLLGTWWGLLAVALSLLCPPRWRVWVMTSSLALAGTGLATLGVTGVETVGPVIGQLLGLLAISCFVLAPQGAPVQRTAAGTPGDESTPTQVVRPDAN